VVIELDPVSDDAHRMRLGLETVTMHAGLLQDSDDTLHRTVLLRTVRRDEFLLQPAAPYQPGILPTGGEQAIVGARQERNWWCRLGVRCVINKLEIAPQAPAMPSVGQPGKGESPETEVR
jgi:hypothetical protein